MDFKILAKELVYPSETVELEPTPVLDADGNPLTKIEAVYDEKGNVVVDTVPVTEMIDGKEVPKTVRVIVPNPDDPGVIHMDVPVMRKVTRTQEVPVMQQEFEAVPNEDNPPDGMKFTVEVTDGETTKELEFTIGKAAFVELSPEQRVELVRLEAETLFFKPDHIVNPTDWTEGLV